MKTFFQQNDLEWIQAEIDVENMYVVILTLYISSCMSYQCTIFWMFKLFCALCLGYIFFFNVCDCLLSCFVTVLHFWDVLITEARRDGIQLTHWLLKDLDAILKHKFVLLIGIYRSSYDQAPRWLPHDLTDDKSTLVEVMAWCRQATSHCLSQ